MSLPKTEKRNITIEKTSLRIRKFFYFNHSSSCIVSVCLLLCLLTFSCQYQNEPIKCDILSRVRLTTHVVWDFLCMRSASVADIHSFQLLGSLRYLDGLIFYFFSCMPEQESKSKKERYCTESQTINNRNLCFITPCE